MKIEVPREVISETTKCHKQLACLREPVETICKVKSCIMNQVHFVQFHNLSWCAYQIHSHNCVVCACPVRMEIYQRYQI